LGTGNADVEQPGELSRVRYGGKDALIVYDGANARSKGESAAAAAGTTVERWLTYRQRDGVINFEMAHIPPTNLAQRVLRCLIHRMWPHGIPELALGLFKCYGTPLGLRCELYATQVYQGLRKCRCGGAQPRSNHT
jgi:hypothetical protein